MVDASGNGLAVFGGRSPSEKLGQHQRSERIRQAGDWVRIWKLVVQVYNAPEGRQAFPIVTVKVLLLE